MKPEIINLLTWEDVKEIAVAYHDASFAFAGAIVKDGNEYSFSERVFFNSILERLRDNNMSEGKRRYLYLIEIAEKATGCKATKLKTRGSVLTRSFVSYRLWREGMTYMDIGRITDRDHATIINQVRKVEDIIKMPNAFKEESEMYHEFEKLIEDGE